MEELELDCLAIIEEKTAQLAEKDKEIAMLRDALYESHALNVNVFSDAEPEVSAYYSEHKAVIKLGKQALALDDLPSSFSGTSSYIHTDKVKPLVEESERVTEWLNDYRLSKGLGERFPPLKCLKDAIAQYRKATGE